MTENGLKDPGPPAPSKLIGVVAPLLAAAALVGKSVATAAAPVTTADTYLHLRLGEMFRTEWTPWHPGQLDRHSTNHWYPTQWLSQIVMSWIQSVGGLPAIAWTYELFFLALLASWYLSARRSADPLVAAVATGLAFTASSGSLSARPQMASFLLATITVAAWNRARTTRRIPWWLVPVAWFWAMVHGMWIVGVAISCVAAVVLVLDNRLARRAVLVPSGMLAVALVTPAGPGLVGAVVLVGSRSGYITEWAAPTLFSAYGLSVLALVGVAVVAMLRGSDVELYDGAMMVLATAFAIYSIRTVPIAASIALPLTARHLQSLVGASRRPSRREVTILGIGCALALALTAVLVPRTSTEPPRTITSFQAQLDLLPDRSVVLTDWPDGGPLEWLEPRLDVPIQGYVDVYTDTELKRYSDMMSLLPEWDRTLRAMHPAAALLPDQSSVTYALQHIGWRAVAHHDDRTFLVPPPSWTP